jgi:hypothetical protein
MRYKAWGLLTVVASLLAGAHCGDGPGDSGTLTAFISSGCKSKMTGQALTSQSTGSIGYDGLKCVAWEVASDNTVFRLYNVEGGCGASYEGHASIADSGRAVTLSLTNPSGAIAGCGWCVYDFTFQVRGPVTGSNLTVAIERSNSAEPGREGTTTFTLPAQSRATGIVCSYGNEFAMRDHARKTGLSGHRNFPCDVDIVPSNGGCQPGLACTPSATGAAQPLCLAPCAASLDCGDDQLYGCSAGLCKLAPPAP